MFEPALSDHGQTPGRFSGLLTSAFAPPCGLLDTTGTASEASLLF